ncbi:MAG: hypothetical protein ABEJ44_07560 [Halanaeroarchaeum sp.]
MRVRLEESVEAGRAIDLRDRDVDPTELLAAVRSPDESLVAAPRPGRIHAFVGRIEPNMTISLRGAVATAARSRGEMAPHDDAIAGLDRRIADIDVEPVDVVSPRRRVAAAGTNVASLREEVARLRGRLEADGDAGRPTDRTRSDLRAAIAELAEAETERHAAEQSLRATEAEARAMRDRRERRLTLVDERDNLARRGRSALAEREYPRFRRALAALPVEAAAGEAPEEFVGESVAAALAVARIATVRAPVVLVDGPFSAAIAARAALDAPVLLV